MFFVITIISFDENNLDGRYFNYYEKVEVQVEVLEEGYIIKLRNWLKFRLWDLGKSLDQGNIRWVEEM